ncbi:MAG: DUF2218 domain-containing protein [Geminicoccaceae bacterium]
MIQSLAQVATTQPSRYLQQLCKHFAHKLPVSFDTEAGSITFAAGRCQLAAREGVLELRAEAEDEARLREVENVVQRHLERFAFREPPTVLWQPA